MAAQRPAEAGVRSKPASSSLYAEQAAASGSLASDVLWVAMLDRGLPRGQLAIDSLAGSLACAGSATRDSGWGHSECILPLAQSHASNS